MGGLPGELAIRRIEHRFSEIPQQERDRQFVKRLWPRTFPNKAMGRHSTRLRAATGLQNIPGYLSFGMGSAERDNTYSGKAFEPSRTPQFVFKRVAIKFFNCQILQLSRNTLLLRLASAPFNSFIGLTSVVSSLSSRLLDQTSGTNESGEKIGLSKSTIFRLPYWHDIDADRASSGRDHRRCRR